MRVAGRDLSVTITIGLSLFPTDGQAPDDPPRYADHATYRPEASGDRGNKFALFGTAR